VSVRRKIAVPRLLIQLVNDLVEMLATPAW